jgi:hypothetical protein
MNMNLIPRVPGLALVAFFAFVNTLHGDFCFDDNFAVKGNKDVTDPNASFVDLWFHDFWGQRIAKPDSHKSYRCESTSARLIFAELASSMGRMLQR